MDSERDLMPDESEQLDQLQADETLVYRDVPDVLDEGYIAPEEWSAAQGFGNTAAEQAEGETLEMRVAQEIPDPPEPGPDPEPWNDDPSEKREVGTRRAGRLVDGETGTAVDVGIAGAAATAEEAAMHIISEDDPDEYDD